MPFISLTAVLDNLRDFQIIDIRKPSLFGEGHLPNALNIPFFFKEDSLPSMLQTWSRSPPADPHHWMDHFAGSYRALSRVAKPSRRTLLYGADGDIQAKILEWILAGRGEDLFFLSGGFEAFQEYQKLFFSRPRRLILLTGYSGSGKTRVLRALTTLGASVIDLEKLANHNGSVFGSPVKNALSTGSQEFHNRLWEALLETDPAEPLFVEQKGDFIGSCPIPEGLLHQFKTAKRILLKASFEYRAGQLLKTYRHLDENDLTIGVKKLRSKLPPALYASCQKAVHDGDQDRLVRLLLPHYDQTEKYAYYTTSPWLELDSETEAPEVIGRSILAALKESAPIS